MIVRTYSVVQKPIKTEYVQVDWSDVLLVCSGDTIDDKSYDKIFVVVKNIPYYCILQIKMEEFIRYGANDAQLCLIIKQQFSCARVVPLDNKKYKSFYDTNYDYCFY
jgi:hypothetical protein